MRDEYFWTLVVLVWVFGWAAVWLIRRRAEERSLLERRRLLHQERMTAIGKGVPLPEIPQEEEALPPWLRPETERLRSAWMRRLTLALGLVSLLTGIGLCVAFYWAPDRGFHGIWTIGFIPAMAGIGFLLYNVLARTELSGGDL